MAETPNNKQDMRKLQSCFPRGTSVKKNTVATAVQGGYTATVKNVYGISP